MMALRCDGIEVIAFRLKYLQWIGLQFLHLDVGKDLYMRNGK